MAEAVGPCAPRHRVPDVNDAFDAARAVDALRRGWPVRVEAADGGLTLLAVETADQVRLEAFGADALLLTPARAATLGLGADRTVAGGGPVLVALDAGTTHAAAVALADPTLDLATPLKGPFAARALGTPAAARAAIELARIAGLLPAFLVGQGEPRATVHAVAVAAHEAADDLVIASRARLPVSAVETGEIVAFRRAHEAGEQVALVIGRGEGPPLVRLHSECLTGDVFGSLRCDCGPQLNGALGQMGAGGWGILLYLRQEGRGIGLVNKLRAYQLQDQGFDTIDANVRLGFAADARDFRLAARMLDLLGQRAVRLLTNNPLKVEGLEAAGIRVVERVPLAITANPHNQAYLATKRDRSGHQL